MVDADRRCIIDMIESREAKDVAEWLKSFSGVEIVSRDGSNTYASAISEALPNAIQITDRFHLLQNLTKRAKVCFQRIFQGRIVIPVTSESEHIRQVMSLGTLKEKVMLVKNLKSAGRTKSEITAITGCSREKVKKYTEMDEESIPMGASSTVRGREHDIAVQKVKTRAERVRELKDKGFSICGIERETGFSHSAVKSYLSDDFTPVSGHYGKRQKGKLSKYQNTVLQMRAKEKTYKEIYEVIKAEGYTGTVDAIRGFISNERRIRNNVLQNSPDIAQTELIDKQWIIRVLYKPLKEIPALTKEQFIAILKTYPNAKTIFKMVNRFKGLVSRKDITALSKWIEDALALDLEEMVSFANGLKGDLDAVHNALKYDYSNGVAEGSVNKVKVIKRIMYGRCGFDLLRNKILNLEKLRLAN